MAKVTKKEADRLEAEMRKMAAEWREKLKDPILQQLIREGKATVSPLVTKLLEAFPEESKTREN